MSLRFKLAAMASAMALAVAAVAFAAPAFAVDNQTLCVTEMGAPHDVQCAYTNTSYFVYIKDSIDVPAGWNKWNINTSSSGYHQISSTTGEGCMFLAAEGEQVYLTACDGYTFEEWRIKSSNAQGIELQNEAFPSDCLNDHYQVGQVNGAPCNGGTDQRWFAEAS
jgi:hypothetical protein